MVTLLACSEVLKPFHVLCVVLGGFDEFKLAFFESHLLLRCAINYYRVYFGLQGDLCKQVYLLDGFVRDLLILCVNIDLIAEGPDLVA